MDILIEPVKSIEGEDFTVATFTGKEELSRLSEFSVDLVCKKPDIQLDKLLGKLATFKILSEASDDRFLNGHISRIAHAGMKGQDDLYRAELRPWLWFLTLTKNCRIFQEKSIPDILKEVFDGHSKIAKVKFSLSETYTPWDYCVQYRESDFDFVSRLMEHEGIYYYFEYVSDQHTLVIVDSPAAHKSLPDCETLKYATIDRGKQRSLDLVYDWQVSHEVLPTVFAHADYDFEKPSVDLHAKSVISRSHDLGEYEVYDYPGEYHQRDDGETYAKTRIEELQSRFEKIRGASNNRYVRVGHLFGLEMHPRSDQNDQYLVISTNVKIDNNPSNQNPEGKVQDSFKCDFSVIRSKEPFRPERLTPKPVIQGFQTALVVGTAGELIHTDKYGRIKVHFHWDRFDKQDENSSCWIRVSQTWGGKGWGGMFIPHVGQEVVVQFLEGDPDRPLIMGRVYNSEQMPPLELPANKTKSAIRDHGGNEIIMEGAAGAQNMRLHSPTHATTITLGNSISGATDSKIMWVAKGDWISDIGENVFNVFHANSTTKISADSYTETRGNTTSVTQGSSKSTVYGKNSSIVVGTSFSMTVGHYTEIYAGSKLTIAAPFQAEITRGWKLNRAEASNIDFSGSRIVKTSDELQKKGAIVKKIGKVLHVVGTIVDKYDNWKIKTGPYKKLSDWVQDKVGGDMNIECGGDYNVNSDGAVGLKSGASITLKASGAVILDAPVLSVKQKLDVNGKTDIGNGTLTISP